MNGPILCEEPIRRDQIRKSPVGPRGTGKPETSNGAAVEIVPFEAGHFSQFRLQQAQRIWAPFVCESIGRTLTGGLSWTGILDGMVLGCGGLVPVAPGCANAWAMLSDRLETRHFKQVHFRVLQVLDLAHQYGFQRIEAEIDPSFPGNRALRWVNALGFETEGYLRADAPDGRDMLRVARIKP